MVIFLGTVAYNTIEKDKTVKTCKENTTFNDRITNYYDL